MVTRARCSSCTTWFTQSDFDLYLSLFGDLSMLVDGVERYPVVWEDWAVTTRVDTSAFRECGRRSIVTRPRFQPMRVFAMPWLAANLWSTQNFFRAMSLVNSGRAVEDDLFAGIRTRFHL